MKFIFATLVSAIFSLALPVLADSLAQAAYRGDFEKVTELLQESSQEIDECDEIGMTALMNAASKGHQQIFFKSLERAAKINRLDQHKTSPAISFCSP